MDLDELKNLLRGKGFALDEVVPLMRKAALVIDELESENQALTVELRKYQSVEPQLAKLKESLDALIAGGERMGKSAKGLGGKPR